MGLRDLSMGMSGEDVRALQQGLNVYFGESRPLLEANGVFDESTRDALEAFQRANPGTGNADGSPDLVFGQRTRRKLFPLAVVTVVAQAFRLQMPSFGSSGIKPPNLGPGPLKPPGTPDPGLRINPYYNPDDTSHKLNVDFSNFVKKWPIDFKTQHFPGLRLPLPAPSISLLPQLSLNSIPPKPSGPASGPEFTSNSVHHFELAPGAQMMLQNPSQTAFTLGLQGVAMIGDEEGAHQEFAMGTQMASPNADGSGGWTILWYAQITDVDRFGSIGQFHWWQWYAQFGIQNVHGSFRPVIAGNLFPVNLGFDVNKNVTIQIAGGLAMTYDPVTGKVQAGVQGTAGFVLKFDFYPNVK